MPMSFYKEEPMFKEITFTGIDKKTRTLRTNQYFLAQMFAKIKNGYSVTIAICGNQRVGKSMIGLWLCYLFSTMMGKKFNPRTNTFYEPIAAIENLEKKDKEALLIDESADLLDLREWYDQTHQALKSIINTQGYKTLVYVFIAPFISDIDKAFTKHFDFLIRVDARGHYKTFRFMKRFDELNPARVVSKIFLDDCLINMKQLPKKIWKDYEEFSIEEKEKIRQKRVNKIRRKTIEDPIGRLKVMMRGT